MNEVARWLTNPAVVPALLLGYGTFLLVLVACMYAKYRKAARMLGVMQQDWNSTQSSHKSFLDQARAKVGKLPSSRATQLPVTVPLAGRRTITLEMRNQITSMARRGFAGSDIARSSGLPECEVTVLLGYVRLQK